MALESGFQLLQWQVRPDQNRLIGNGSDIRITPRAMEVLVCLAGHAGQVVTREDFNRQVWSPAIVTDDALTRCISEIRRSLGDRAAEPRFIETIPKRGYRLVAPVTRLDPGAGPEGPVVRNRGGGVSGTLRHRPVRRDSIAVLPLQTIGGEAVAPLAAGIHQDLLTRLAAVSGLKVISSTSVRRYRDTEYPIPEIAAELGVAWIVEGAVQQAGGHLQVNAQLIDAARDHHLWARTYRQPYSAENLFAIQAEIMDDIAASLEKTLDSGKIGQRERNATDNLEAYARYMQGRSFLDTRTEPGMRQALMYFRNALERDGDYALAWVGVADAQMLLYDYYDLGTPEAVRPAVEQALGRALQLEPDLAGAHASTGLFHMSHAALGPLRAEGLDGAEAVKWLRQAVERQPGYAEAHNWLSWVLQLLGYADAALAYANSAIELNPLAPEAIHNLMSSNMACGHFGRGLREARRIEELGMYDATPRFYEAVALHHLGRFDAAVDLLEGLTVEWAGLGAQSALALAEVRRGNPNRARGLLGEIDSGNDPFCGALVRAALGRHDQALEAMASIRCWGQWPALVLHHYYGEELAVLRASPCFGSVMAALRQYYGLPADGHGLAEFGFGSGSVGNP